MARWLANLLSKILYEIVGILSGSVVSGDRSTANYFSYKINGGVY